MRIFKDIDFLGDTFALNFKGESRMKTKLGGFVCLVLGIIFILLIIGFGQDFFKRINPNVIRETESSLDYPTYNITNKKFSIAFSAIDLNGYILNERIAYLSATLAQFKFVNGSAWETIYYDSIEINLCTKEDFYDPEDFDRFKLGQQYCPRFKDTTLGGSWSSTSFVGYIYVSIYLCKEGKVNLKNEPCLPDNVTANIADNPNAGIYYSHYIPNSLVTPSNYYNGVRNTLINEYFRLSRFLFKQVYYYFYETMMKTDYGWILQTNYEDKVLGFRSKSYDFNLVTSDVIGQVYYYFTNERDIYSRYYMKIQTLVANVGGILKVFMTLGYFIVSYYNYLCWKSEMIQYSDIDFCKQLENKYNYQGENNNIFNNEIPKSLPENIVLPFKLQHNSKEISNKNEPHIKQIKELNNESSQIQSFSKFHNSDLNLNDINRSKVLSHQEVQKEGSPEEEGGLISNIVNKLKFYNKLGSINYIEKDNLMQENHHFSVYSFLYKRIFSLCSKTFNLKFRYLSLYLNNLDKLTDLELIIKNEKFYKKICDCMLEKKHKDGISYELNGEEKEVLRIFRLLES